MALLSMKTWAPPSSRHFINVKRFFLDPKPAYRFPFLSLMAYCEPRPKATRSISYASASPVYII